MGDRLGILGAVDKSFDVVIMIEIIIMTNFQRIKFHVPLVGEVSLLIDTMYYNERYILYLYLLY